MDLDKVNYYPNDIWIKKSNSRIIFGKFKKRSKSSQNTYMCREMQLEGLNNA
ncbi:hypothetical protein Hanom_Chr05g00442461 [Helianthus anomalus]